MSEKVMLTEEQEKAIQTMLEHCSKEALVGGFANETYKGDSFYQPLYKIINSLTLDEVIRAVYMEDYVVVPPFELGVWVVEPVNEKIGRITEINDRGDILTDYGSWYLPQQLRPATSNEIIKEKERRMRNELNRKENEFKKGDVVWLDNGTYTAVHFVSENCIVDGKSNNSWRFDRVTLVCPVEYRLDLG